MAETIALGAHRLPLSPDAPREERVRRSREMLSHALTGETTVAVVGSGCSTPLGYPTWRGLARELVEKALAMLTGSGAAGDVSGLRQRLLAFQGRLETERPVDSPELMFAIGLAKRVLTRDPGPDNLYHHYLSDRFRPAETPPWVEHNPHRALLRLPIQRFVTTNYDCEIERSLRDERGIAWEDFGIEAAADPAGRSRPLLSFTQEPANPDQLALFALSGVSDAKNMVFHCHGRYDHPDSVIATEADYQRWYLAEEGEGERPPAFLQTFDLLFNSNPILFVGFGLGDEDLLRPLRRIAATTPERAPFRPLFALLSEASEGEDWNRHELLFERYGLNVIPFLCPAGSDTASWGRALSNALQQIEEDRLAWRDGWFDKPMFRTVSVRARPPQPYRHYSIDSRAHETLGRAQVEQQIEEFKQEALAGARVIGLAGPGGTGKSWHAMRLLEEMTLASGFKGFFFWSSYYADDSLTGLDRLLGYLDRFGDRTISRMTRLRECLAKGRYLIVFDGFERLLRPTEDPEMGRTNEPATKRMLEIFAEPCEPEHGGSDQPARPQDLDSRHPGIKKHVLARMRTGDIAGVEPFNSLERGQVSMLCSLLEGHAYALFLAARLIRQGPLSETQERFLDLRRELAKAHPVHRLGTMIDRAVEAADRETGNLARALLERLAVFMSPVSGGTVLRCLMLASEGKESQGAKQPSVGEMIDCLENGGLLFKVTSGPVENGPPAFTTHPTVRSYIFEQADEVGHDVLPNFTLAGFTSSRAAVHPGSRATAQRVRELFDRLRVEAENALQTGRDDVARDFCRSLFGMMRSRMESNTVSRWTTYGEYIRFGLHVVDLAKRLSPGLWSFREPHELAAIEDAAAPLYADELAFVYNDIGLTLCAEGYMQDTLDVWEQGYEINRILEGTAEVPLYSLQSQLHLGHTFLELGHLAVASQYLKEAAQTNYKVQDLDYACGILGYQALIRQYGGHLDEAEEMYGRTMRILKRAGGNPRAQSFFLNHRAKLAMVTEHFDEASQYVQSSRALAASSRADDLIAYCRTAQGRLYREQSSFELANIELHAALAEASRLGIRRLEAEILTGLSRVALGLGDTALARRRAIAALGIANELGLGLRQTQSLVLLGIATVKAGHLPLGTAYLRLARKLGEQQGYRLRSREAEQELQRLEQEERSR